MSIIRLKWVHCPSFSIYLSALQTSAMFFLRKSMLGHFCLVKLFLFLHSISIFVGAYLMFNMNPISMFLSLRTQKVLLRCQYYASMKMSSWNSLVCTASTKRYQRILLKLHFLKKPPPLSGVFCNTILIWGAYYLFLLL
jgi:hypothetical protein